MLQGLINQCKRRMSQLEKLMENNEGISPEWAEKIIKAYEEEHELLKMLTGDKGDRRPED